MSTRTRGAGRKGGQVLAQILQDTSESSSVRSMPARLLLAEDDDELRRMLASAFRRDGHVVHEARDGHELLEAFAGTIREAEPDPSFDVIISDIRLPGPSGLQVLAEIHALRSAPPMILITAFGDEETHMVAHFLGSAAILDKPFDIDELRFEVVRALGWA